MARTNEDKAHREYLASLSISPETTRMDVEPDNPNVSYRTIQYEGRALRINAGKNVEVSLTFASILGNAANPIRTEQMRAGADAGVVITDLRS